MKGSLVLKRELSAQNMLVSSQQAGEDGTVVVVQGREGMYLSSTQLHAPTWREQHYVMRTHI